MYMVGDSGRRGYGELLSSFWASAASAGVKLPQAEPVSAPAFCNARKKLRPALLQVLLSKARAALETSHGDRLLWHGRRVFAVDGCRFNLQRSDELLQRFGMPHGGHCPQALVSTLYDVIGQVPCAATIAPRDSCERQELLKLMPWMHPGDIVVLDRGYPSFDVLQAFHDADIDIVVRVPKSSTFDAIGVFQQAAGDDHRVFLRPGLEFRAVRIDCGGKEPWLLLTSVRRCQITISQMAELYHLRWTIEEFFKLLKGDFFGQRQFHSKSADGVEQELRAQFLFVVLARILAADAAQAVDAPLEQIITKSSILALAEVVATLFLLDDRDAWALTHHPQLLRRIAHRRYKARRGRSCPRRSFKPGPRWNAKGRTGS